LDFQQAGREMRVTHIATQISEEGDRLEITLEAVDLEDNHTQRVTT